MEYATCSLSAELYYRRYGDSTCRGATTSAHAFPLNCCFHPLGHVPVHASPLSLFILLHSTFAVPPFLGLMLISLNFSPVQGAPDRRQCQPLYRPTQACIPLLQ
jgi:hypothetical protein